MYAYCIIYLCFVFLKELENLSITRMVVVGKVVVRSVLLVVVFFSNSALKLINFWNS
ncbi:hypothetical protein SDJN02_27886, partial [Cucurbita argyrosperma subsp. argyrosperma]